MSYIMIAVGLWWMIWGVYDPHIWFFFPLGLLIALLGLIRAEY